METIYLSGLNRDGVDRRGNLAKNVFEVQQAVAEPTAGTITLRAPERTLKAFNATMSELLDGRSQVLLEVRMIQLAHTSERNTGVQPPQTMTAFNVYAEEQSILNANQSLVQQIISSGLAAPGDTLAILGILLASGQVSSSLFSNGIALFGGGLTPIRAGAGRDIGQSQPELFGLARAGPDSVAPGRRRGRRRSSRARDIRSRPLRSPAWAPASRTFPDSPARATPAPVFAAASRGAAAFPTIPQVEYQDLGLTLKATPKVMRNDEVALTIDMKIDCPRRIAPSMAIPSSTTAPIPGW